MKIISITSLMTKKFKSYNNIVFFSRAITKEKAMEKIKRSSHYKVYGTKFLTIITNAGDNKKIIGYDYNVI